MKRGSRELWLAGAALIGITAVYLFVVYTFQRIPQASGFFGHAIGVFGFVLMLMTETLYSLRKRSRSARWGRMAAWLDFHIFTGIVGPYLVLLHTSWKFNGLAGLVTLLTLVVVASGFIGRYIYTAVPRSVDGAELEASQLESQITAAGIELRSRLAEQPQLAALLSAGPPAPSQADSWRLEGRDWNLLKKNASVLLRPQLDELEKLARRQETLRRQVASLAAARRLLAIWHSVHIPIGMALFTAAFVHAGAALYYVTLMK